MPSCHAFETSSETLTESYLPLLLRTAGAIRADWAQWDARPELIKERRRRRLGTGRGT